MRHALVLAAVLAARPAFASPCHGGGGGGGGGGFHGGGGGGGGGGGCSDSSDIVGIRHCTPFGAWAANLRLPHIFIEMGSNVRHFASLLRSRDTAVTHGAETFAYRVVAPQSGYETAVTSVLRMGADVRPGLYVALEGEVGGLVSPVHASAEMMTGGGAFGSPDISQSGSILFDGFAVAGVRGTVGHGALALEMAGGGRAIFYGFHSAYHECEQDQSVSGGSAVVEARARADVWLNPWISASAAIGSSVIARGDWFAGLYVGVHSRAFGGQR